jgi:hypothetical protein
MKILHIGNIANNAYLNAKILNSLGHENHVLSYDYYHIMGCPEWEEIEIPPNKIDDFKPEWHKVNQNFERPKWFVQGPLEQCLDYLISLNTKRADQDELWQMLGEFNRIRPRSFNDKLKYLKRVLKNKSIAFFEKFMKVREVKDKWLRLKTSIVNETGNASTLTTDLLNSRVYTLSSDYQNLFKERGDVLSREDVLLFDLNISKLREVFKHYDAICCYGITSYMPLIAGTEKYVAYEHGSIRSFAFQNSSIGRITALAFAKASAVLMTNADSVNLALRLNQNLVLGCHGFIIEEAQKKAANYKDVSLIRERLMLKLTKSVTILQSTRQKWDVKGNDKFLKALVDLKSVTDDFDVIFVDWGEDVAKTKTFLRDNGLNHNVHWISPLSKPQLLRLYQEVDVIVDQFNIPCIGSTPLEIFAVKGGVLITHLDDEIMSHFYGETIPLLNCANDIQISDSLKNIVNGNIDLLSIKNNCYEWLQKTHSQSVIANHLLKAYKS